MKRIVVLPDVHLDLEPSPAYATVKRFLTSYKADEIVLLGDFGNFTSLSHWIEHKRRPLENKRYMKEIYALRHELDFLQKHTKKVTYIEGNHEFWIEVYIDKFSQLEGLIELGKMLDLKERGIEWVRLNDLYCIGANAKLYMTHGMYTTKYHAHKHLSSMGCNIIYGHCHQPQVALLNMKMTEPYMAWGLGWLGNPEEMKYLSNRPVNWIHQFAIVEMTLDMFSVQPINIINNQFIYNGKIHS